MNKKPSVEELIGLLATHERLLHDSELVIYRLLEVIGERDQQIKDLQKANANMVTLYRSADGDSPRSLLN